MKLCTRLYHPETGSVAVNGVPIARIDIPRTVAVVEREPLLFEGSVFDNIRIGTAAGAEHVAEAARLACLHNEVMELERGYDAPVGYSGEHISQVRLATPRLH
eukprot:2053175-Pyramimonas_sp.AAC.1